jgi:cytochrome c biogenesis DsbD-like protein
VKRALCTVLKKSSGCHSERSEESAFDQNPRKKQIPRANTALGMTRLRVFHQPVRILCFAIAAACAAFAPTASAQVPSGKDVVKAEVYTSMDPAGRGGPFQIAVVMKIRPGFHVNAREKSEEYLIATDLKAQFPSGFTGGEIVYPKGKLETFTFSRKPLNVYQGTVILRLPVNALATAPVGEQHIPLKLRYQACSTELCLPPVTIPLDAAVNIAASASEVKPAHSGIFAKQ